MRWSVMLLAGVAVALVGACGDGGRGAGGDEGSSGGGGGSGGVAATCDLDGVIGAVWATRDCVCDEDDPPFCICYVIGLAADGTYHEETLMGRLDGHSNVDVDCWDGTWTSDAGSLALTDCNGERTELRCTREGDVLRLGEILLYPDDTGFVGCEFDHCD